MRYRLALRIRAPIEEVFDLSIDPRKSLAAAHPRGTTITKVTDGPIGMGTVFRYDRPGKEGWIVSEIVEFDPPHSFVTAARHQNSERGRMTFREEGGVTRVETEADFDPLPRPLKWLTPLVYALLWPGLWLATKRAERWANRALGVTTSK